VSAGGPKGGFDPACLPVFSPDPALWPRIVAARRVAARRQRRRTAVAGLAMAASAALAVWLLPSPVVPPPHGVADGQRESRLLEGEWQRMAARAPGGLARLHGIDAALQAAYDKGAGPDELAPLWRQRNRALRGLIAEARAGRDGESGLTRI
jgi:hypothetical protein